MVGNRKAVPSANNRRARRVGKREELIADGQRLIEELKALIRKSERFIMDGENPSSPSDPTSAPDAYEHANFRHARFRQTRRPVRALVVDDQYDAAESLSRLLQSMGCAATFVTQPSKALDAVDSLEAEIIFLRSGISEIAANQLARMFRERYGDALMLVAVTDARENYTRSRAAGFDAHVVTPVDSSLVQSMIETVLLNRR